MKLVHVESQPVLLTPQKNGNGPGTMPIAGPSRCGRDSHGLYISPHTANETEAGLGELSDSTELDFGRFRRREREHFPCAARYGTEFLYCLGLAGT